MTVPAGGVKEFAQDRLEAGGSSDDDAEREVVRAAGADERSGQLEIRARVDEQPAVLVAEAERAELVIPPSDHALILGGQLVRRVGKLGGGHICSNEQIRAEFVCGS